MWGAAIGAGASLLGGLLGSKKEKKAIAAQNAYNDPSAMRARAEKAGFNPLLWAGQGNMQTTAGNSGAIMGNAIANAGLALADGMTERKQLELEKTKLQLDRDRLDALIEKNTIQPKVAGIYAGTRQTPSIKRTGAPLMSGAPAYQGGKNSTIAPWEKILDSSPNLVIDETGFPTFNPEKDGPEFERDVYELARQGELPPVAWDMMMLNINAARDMLPDYHPLSNKALPRKVYDAFKPSKEEKKRRQQKMDKAYKALPNFNNTRKAN